MAAKADAAAEHQPATAVPLPVMMEPAAPEAGPQQTASLAPKAEPAMPSQQQLVPENNQQTAPPSPKVEPGMPHVQQQQQLPVRQGAAGAGTPAVKQEVPIAATAAGEQEGARVGTVAPKQESQAVEGHGGLATGAVDAAAACQGSGQPKIAEQPASARHSAEAVDEDDEPEDEEEEESNVSVDGHAAGLSAVLKSGSSHCCPGR